MLSVKQAAEEIGLTPDTLYRLCKAGKLAHYRLGAGGGAIRIKLEDLRAYLESCRVEGAVASSKPEKPLKWVGAR